MEYVLDVEMSDPLWIQIVINNFCLPSSGPVRILLIARSRFQRAHWIWNRQEIQIDQVLSLNEHIHVCAFFRLYIYAWHLSKYLLSESCPKAW